MGIIFYGLGAIGLVTLLTYGIAFILKRNSPYKNNAWLEEHNQRVLLKFKPEIVRYDVLLSIHQHALKEAKTELTKAELSRDINKINAQKAKYLKSVGFLS